MTWNFAINFSHSQSSSHCRLLIELRLILILQRQSSISCPIDKPGIAQLKFKTFKGGVCNVSGSFDWIKKVYPYAKMQGMSCLVECWRNRKSTFWCFINLCCPVHFSAWLYPLNYVILFLRICKHTIPLLEL